MRLPLNGAAFFKGKNKPNHYIYNAQDLSSGVLTDRQKPISIIQDGVVMAVPVVNTQTNKITYSTDIRPKANTEPVILPKTNPVTTNIKKPEISSSLCKHRKVLKDPSCGCARGIICDNSECPLSQPMPSGTKKKLIPQDCTKQSCRWFSS